MNYIVVRNIESELLIDAVEIPTDSGVKYVVSLSDIYPGRGYTGLVTYENVDEFHEEFTEME